jgi:hypothetical protein
MLRSVPRFREEEKERDLDFRARGFRSRTDRTKTGEQSREVRTRNPCGMYGRRCDPRVWRPRRPSGCVLRRDTRYTNILPQRRRH